MAAMCGCCRWLPLARQQVLTQMGNVFSIRFPPFFGSLLQWIGLLQLDLSQRLLVLQEPLIIALQSLAEISARFPSARLKP